MTLEKQLHQRSESRCELCNATEMLKVYEVPPASSENADKYALICENCLTQIENPDEVNSNHWRCLNDSMWSQVPAVQVVAWRMLHRLRSEDWSIDLLDMLFLDEETLAWAQVTGEGINPEEIIKHLDSNGQILESGDTVVLIKDLKVKGGGFTAKRGTAVRRISLVADNPEHIEGRVNDQHIVILTKYVKKSK